MVIAIKTLSGTSCLSIRFHKPCLIDDLLYSFCTELKESNVRLKLTFVDTVGFGDQIDKTDRLVLSFFPLSFHLFSSPSCFPYIQTQSRVLDFPTSRVCLLSEGKKRRENPSA